VLGLLLLGTVHGCARRGVGVLPDIDDSTGQPSADAAPSSADDAAVPTAPLSDGAVDPRDAAREPADAAGPEGDALVPPDPACLSGSALYALGTVAATGEYALKLRARASVDTRWGVKGSEAVVLEVLADGRLVGHLVLHQGASPFDYSMHLGSLAAGTRVEARVSTLSAPATTAEACVESALLPSAVELGGDARGLTNAPVFLWPVQKRFDDLPLLVGFSDALGRYEVVYSNENGGTTTSCGGGSKGIRSTPSPSTCRPPQAGARR
jgi:hypothetical protein